MDNTLEVRQLCCERGDKRLFSDLNFSLPAGSLLYVEGANGSGKTTLLRALCGLFTPECGQVLWNGEDSHKLGDAFRDQVIYLGHHNSLKLDLTGIENLHFSLAVDGVKAGEEALLEALASMGLAGYEDLPVRVLSQGQKRRVALARLLLTESPLWILDEPFTALDVKAVDHLQSIIASHVNQGGMAILTTHQEVALTSGQIQRIRLGEHV